MTEQTPSAPPPAPAAPVAAAAPPGLGVPPVPAGYPGPPLPPPLPAAPPPVREAAGAAGGGERTGSRVADWFGRLVRGGPLREPESGPDPGAGSDGAFAPAAQATPDGRTAPATGPSDQGTTGQPGSTGLAGGPAAPALPGSARQQPAPPLSAQAQAVARALEQLPAAEREALFNPASQSPAARALQAEVDRRRTLELRRSATQTGALQRAELEQRERTARQTDVYEAARLRDELDGLQQQEQFIGGLVRAYDAATLDPLLLALPEADRAGVLSESQRAADAVEARQQLVAGSLKGLERHWRQAERERLRKDPTFRKEVLADIRAGTNGSGFPVARQRGQRAPQGQAAGAAVPAMAVPVGDGLGNETGQSPEVFVGRGPGAPPATINDWLRQQIRR